ncbi:TerC/Alx family metal homeostasis membrane protein [Mycobacterium sp. SMC-11]|uniref:TerC/Alx family metal homeostasis membrane protein n=1 Tax=Mycobacterium sp. SMC-11 TaxID=3385969 RepID=UPI00390CD43E
MDIAGWLWALTIVGLLGLLAFDFFMHVRKAHIPTLRESALWSAGYVGVAVLFGVGVFVFGGADPGSEYFAGYVTEKALSVDNLFVFLVIMASFRVPRADQQKVLLFGIVMALAARTGFILLGAALINRFSWVFYFFGLLLLLAAGNMLRSGSAEEAHRAPDVIVGLVKKVVPTTERYVGDRLLTRIDGRWAITPMVLVMLAIAGTDVLFALDSIPAIFGLTQNSYLVFTATAFSLLGLRQLYFLIDQLLDRLVYLSYGLALILGFIGVKLIMHAMHEQGAGGIEIGTGPSLLVIVGVLTGTVIASLRHRRKAPDTTRSDTDPGLVLRR